MQYRIRRYFLEIGANDPEAISEARLFPLIDAVTVRRDRTFLEKHYPNDHFPDGTPVRFPKPQLIEKRYDLDKAYPNFVREIVKCIDSLTMARYRPTAYRKDKTGEAADEEALAGLIRSGLLKRGDLELILGLEARIRTKIAAANAAVGMETPVLANVPMESKIYADLTQYAERLSTGDATLLDSDDGFESGSFRGEEFRARLLRALAKGELERLKSLPWGIGAAFVQPSETANKIQVPGVFFACRTKQGERYWRYVTIDGNIIREDLTMLRLIDPVSAPGSPIPETIDLEALFNRAAADICESHNRLIDPAAREERLPASQRWALSILRHPDAPIGKDFDDADLALGVGRDALVRRALSQLRRKHE